MNRLIAQLRGKATEQPGKATVLGLLCVILVVVTTVQLVRRLPTASAEPARLDRPADLRLSWLHEDDVTEPVPRPDRREAAPSLPMVVRRDIFERPWQIREDDPSKPESDLERAVPHFSGLTLEGTYLCVEDPSRSTAIINGIIVREHERFEGFEITQIGNRFAWVRKDETQYMLRMK